MSTQLKFSERETRPLVAPTEIFETKQQQQQHHPSGWRQWRSWGIALLGALVVTLLYFTRSITSGSSNGNTAMQKPQQDVEIHQSIHTETATTATDLTRKPNNGAPDQRAAPKAPGRTKPPTSQPSVRKSAPPLPKKEPMKVAKTIQDMSQNLAQARSELLNTLRVQYGSYYNAIFFSTETNATSRGRTLFVSGKNSQFLSWSRFQRKLMMKLLTVLLQAKNSDSLSDSELSSLVPFVWATGGHSSTAGHGNFYNQSYTIYLERAAKDVFGGLGLNFTARAYAMGGTTAAPEVAFCMKEIFGMDIDILVWDFGMTDAYNMWMESLYHWRGALINNSSRPIQLAFHAGGGKFGDRDTIVSNMEEVGIAALISSETTMNEAMDAIPDSFGMTQREIDNMPEFVRSFRCDGKFEKGDPYCWDRKYDLSVCPDRKYLATWHPGWKWHAVMGYLGALFLLEGLEVAVKELLLTAEEDPATLLSLLRGAEDVEYAKFTNSPVPTVLHDVFPPAGVDGFDLDILVRGHNFCHTAKLPAEIRHKGILTESTKTGFYSFDKGMGLKIAKTSTNVGETMRLVYSEEDRQDCPENLQMDYKDYFYVDRSEDWKKLVLPNNAEVKEYGTADQPQLMLHGYVAMCLTLCSWGDCPAGVLTRDAFPDKFEIQVNGVAVTQLWPVEECEILRHESGYQFAVNDDGKLDIRVRVKQDTADRGSYLRVSAFIVW